MDNFMDKLTHRFHAQEIIEANAQAEAREASMMRDQIKEYDACLQEMRRLHLKNTETVEAARSLIEQARQIMKQTEAAVGGNEAKEKEQLKRFLAAGARLWEEEKKTQGELKALLEEEKKTQEELKGLCGEEKKTQGELKALCGEERKTQGELKTLLEEEKKIEGELQALWGEEKKTREEAQALCGEERKAREALEAVCREEKGMLDALKESLEKNGALMTENQEKLMAAKESLEEFMHKESVKVYRNVQAALTEELKNRTKEIHDGIDSRESANKPLIILVIVTLLISLGNLGVVVAQLFNLL